MLRTLSVIGTAATLATPALAEGFQRVEDRDRFLSIVENRNLTRFAIRVQVNGGGEITGRAFGQSVSGDWQWRDGYFCRSLFWGQTELGDNCQQVEVAGSTVRFTSDRGTGEYADLTLTK